MSLVALLVILSLEMLGEVDLVVDRIVVVPIDLSIHIIADTEEHRLILEIGLVFKLDTEGEPITAMLYRLLTDVVTVFCHNFRCCLPVIKGKSCNNQLVKGQITDYHRSHKNLLVR